MRKQRTSFQSKLALQNLIHHPPATTDLITILNGILGQAHNAARSKSEKEALHTIIISKWHLNRANKLAPKAFTHFYSFWVYFYCFH